MISAEESIPQKSEGYLYGQSVFFVQFNEVDFFVEDEEQEEFYYVILSKLFPDIRLEKIFPLGGKKNVVKHLSDANTKRSIYIVDKDFDDLLGVIVEHERLFYLDRYCIENYLLDEECLVAFVVSESPKLKRNDVADAMQWPTFYPKLVLSLVQLFGCFLFSQKFDLQSIKNSSSAPESFSIKNQRYSVDQNAVNEYQNCITVVAENASICQDVQRELDLTTSLIGHDLKEVERHVCGKFVLRMAYHYLGAIFGIASVTAESFSYRLAQYCEFKELEYLKVRIHGALVAGGIIAS